MVTLFGRLLQFAITFISLKVMTSLLNPSQMGQVTLITTGISFFALFFINPVGMLFNRRLHAWYDSGRARSYIHLYGVYLLLAAFIAVIICLIISKSGIYYIDLEWNWVLILVAGSILFNTAIQTFIPSLNMLGRIRPFTILNTLTLLTNLLLSISFCLLAGKTAEHWLAGALCSQMLFSIISYLIFFRNYRGTSSLPKISINQSIQAINFCWPVAITVVLQWMHMQGYRFILAEKFGLAELGLFAVGYNLAASLISAGETVLTTWFQPAFYRSINSSNQIERINAWNIYAGRMLPASLLCVSALIAASDLLPLLMLGIDYINAGKFIVLGAIAEWARMVVGLFGLNAHRQMATRQLIPPNALGAFSAFLTLWASINLLGLDIIFAPLSTTIGSSVVVISFLIFDKRSNSNIKLNLHRLLIQAFCLLMLAFLYNSFYKYFPDQGIATIIFKTIAIGLAWSAIAFFMQKDLKGIAWHASS